MKKITYLPANVEDGKGPRFILEPSTHDEQKFLTIIRDALNAVEGSRVRVVGTEDDDVNKANMPAKPVLRMEITLEGPEGDVPEVYVPKGVDKLDTDREIQVSEIAYAAIASSSAGKMKVVKQQRSDGGTTTVRTEDR